MRIKLKILHTQTANDPRTQFSQIYKRAVELFEGQKTMDAT